MSRRGRFAKTSFLAKHSSAIEEDETTKTRRPDPSCSKTMRPCISIGYFRQGPINWLLKEVTQLKFVKVSLPVCQESNHARPFSKIWNVSTRTCKKQEHKLPKQLGSTFRRWKRSWIHKGLVFCYGKSIYMLWKKKK